MVKDYDNACPECGKPVPVTTLGQNKGYRYGYNNERGVELEFYICR